MATPRIETVTGIDPRDFGELTVYPGDIDGVDEILAVHRRELRVLKVVW